VYTSILPLDHPYLRTSYRGMRYRDDAGNTVEENSSVFSLIRMH